jgi:2-C-methyl-D-erythritol 2,4-cyclodiphosphate synthase
VDDIQPNRNIRVGTGFDVHAFEEGRNLVLGGLLIPFEKGLAGHSDADVLLHAIMDALLGAAGCGDIGRHFPDSEEEYKNISSVLLLKKTVEIIKEKGFHIGNIDAAVIAERPKIAPYTAGIIKKIAETLGISEDKINIKGTTTEGLGFTGRGEGIAAQAVCFLYSL